MLSYLYIFGTVVAIELHDRFCCLIVLENIANDSQYVTVQKFTK